LINFRLTRERYVCVTIIISTIEKKYVNDSFISFSEIEKVAADVASLHCRYYESLIN